MIACLLLSVLQELADSFILLTTFYRMQGMDYNANNMSIYINTKAHLLQLYALKTRLNRCFDSLINLQFLFWSHS